MKKKSIIILIALVLVVICVTASGCFTKKVTEDVTLTSANFIFEKVVGEVIDSTVTISCTTSGGTSGGAGVVVSADGYVLTNNHVVKDSTTKTADISFANGEYCQAIMLSEKNSGNLASLDLTLLKITDRIKNDFKPVKLKEEDVKWGEYGVIIGNPKQLGTLCAHAMVSNPKRLMQHSIKTIHSTEFITLDAPVNPGNSGGGFFDASGKLAGIVTLRQYDNSNSNQNVTFGIAYAMPASTVKDYVKAYGINL